ncbi:MAG: hypothetical protein EXQ88_01970 [Alphaproteobacteria bacterium]|nr:hypothetical protein [Alphaproteobacteria bacterium]
MLTLLALTIFASPVAAAAEFRLVLGGTPALTLEGECTVLTATLGVEHVRFTAATPKTLNITGKGVSCTLRKSDPFWRILVVLQQDGRLVAQAETTVAYDWVEVRSAGPWGRASGFRGDPPTTRLTPAPRPR